MVSKGLATVVRHRQDDDQRSSEYDNLLAAEAKAQKAGKGLYGKKDQPTHQIVDITGVRISFLSNVKCKNRL